MSNEIELQIELLQKYPWLPSLKEKYRNIASEDPYNFLCKTFSRNGNELKKRLLNLFTAAFNNLEQFDNIEINETNIHFYLILKILLYLLKTDAITNRIANLYSKVISDQLLEENDSNLYQICQDLNLDLRYYQDPIQFRVRIIREKKEILKTNYRIHYIDYLKLASNLQDDYRKLVNNPIKEGYVFILKKNLVRLLQEYVRKKILEIKQKSGDNIKDLKKNVLKIREFKDLYTQIMNLWELKKEEFEYSIDIEFKEGEEINTIFPPCIKSILSQAKEGQNLTHTERLYLTFFLHALEYPIDKIVDVFSTLPDFDKEKTTYQVEFAKKKEYTPHSCETLKSLKLCRATEYSDDLCLNGYYSKKADAKRKIKHPLFYVQYKHFKRSHQKPKKNEQS